jgi:hypothetical protein
MRGTAWARIYLELSRAYGWTPAEINQLTIYQAAMYLGIARAERSCVRMSIPEYERRYGARNNPPHSETS